MIEQEDVYQEPLVLGYLKPGAASESGIGKNQGFWRFQPEERYKDAATVFNEIYGPTPTTINIWLSGETVIDCYDEWMVEFGKRSKKQVGKPDVERGYLKKKCTTKRVVRWLDENQVKGGSPYSNVPKPCEQPSCRCERYGVFLFYIVELFVKGYRLPVQFSTKSPNHRNVIAKTLHEEAKILNGMGLSLLGSRMMLEKLEETISKPQFEKNGTLVPGVRDFGKEWMVNLKPDRESAEKIMRAAHDRMVQGSGSSPLMLLPQDVKDIAPTGRMLTPAAVEAMHHPDAIEVEVLESEFKEANEKDKVNSGRIAKLAYSLWKEKQHYEEFMRIVLTALYPNRHTSQLRNGHCDRVVDELLILWSTQQKDHEGLPIFTDQADARAYYQKDGPADGSDHAKRDKWVAIVEAFKRPPT